jgi:DNA (cytosine-5)-methyltransferase 1
LVRFRAAGYAVTWRVLDAKDYGVPQDRRRLFLVGIRSAERLLFKFPTATHGPGRSQPWRCMRDAIWSLRHAPLGSYDDEPFHWYYLSRNRRRTWGQQSHCIVAHWRHVGLHPSSPPLRQLSTDRWEFTSARPARRLSYLECAALQGFSSLRPFEESRDISVKLRFRAIGNAVPPPLFAAVANALVHQLSDRTGRRKPHAKKPGMTIRIRST